MYDTSVLQIFARQKIMTIDRLIPLLQSSAITARRRLKKWNTYTSINKNGRYYALPQIPVFNENGLWRYQSVLFSKHGNLKQTIIWLIHQSQTGLSATEIAKIVDLASTSSFFTQIKTASSITREKHQGRYIYFAGSPENVTRQKRKRALRRSGAFDNLTDAEAVVLLVELIKHPGVDIRQLTAKVQEKGRPVDTTIVQKFLESHDLLKKIPATRR